MVDFMRSSARSIDSYVVECVVYLQALLVVSV